MDACSFVQILKEKLQSLGQLGTNVFSWLPRLAKEQAVNLSTQTAVHLPN